MSIADLLNVAKLHSLMADNKAQLRFATVTSYTPYKVKCVLQPDQTETGWMPVASQWVGSEWGMFSPPSQGDIVILLFAEGEIDAGVVIGRIWTGEAPAAQTPSGEFWLMHQSGSLLKFLNNGDVQLVTNRDLLATVGRNLTAAVDGDLNADISGTATVSADSWNGSGDVAWKGDWTINGAATVSDQITGSGGMNISGGSGGAAATIDGPVNVSGGTVSVTGGDVVVEGISTTKHVHTNGNNGNNTGGPIG